MDANLRLRPSLLAAPLYEFVTEKKIVKQKSEIKGRSWLACKANWLHTQGAREQTGAGSLAREAFRGVPLFLTNPGDSNEKFKTHCAVSVHNMFMWQNIYCLGSSETKHRSDTNPPRASCSVESRHDGPDSIRQLGCISWHFRRLCKYIEILPYAFQN